MTQVFEDRSLFIRARKNKSKLGKQEPKRKGKSAPVHLHFAQFRCLEALGEKKRKKALCALESGSLESPGSRMEGWVGGKAEPGTPPQGQGPNTLISTLNLLTNIIRSSKLNLHRKYCLLGPMVKK